MNMNKNIENLIIFFAGALVGIVLCMIIIDVKYVHHNSIINAGHGQYNSETGFFEWKNHNEN